MPTPIWLQDAASLNELVDAATTHGYIAIDTEFERRNTYWPLPALIQMSLHGQVYLLDPTLDMDFSAFFALLADANTVKFFHSAAEDLEVFSFMGGRSVAQLFDTQVAAALIHNQAMMGYQRLVKEVLDVDLSKDQTLSNWFQRPLSDSQIRYACDDVIYLEQAGMKLFQQSGDRLSWVIADSCAKWPTRVDPNSVYQSLRAAFRLKGKDLTLFSMLAAQREQICMEQNIHRKGVLSEEQLMTIVAKKPSEPEQLKAILRSSRLLNLHADWILETVANWKAGQSPVPESIRGPLPAAAAAFYKELKAALKVQADTLKIPPAQLHRKVDLEEYVWRVWVNGENWMPEQWLGWRLTYLQPILDRMVKK